MDDLRPLAYPDTDIFLVCYSVDNATSAEDARLKWIPEVRGESPNASILLVGTKIDLRDGETVDGIQAPPGVSSTYLSKADGDTTANQMSVIQYMECSALTQKGLDEVFQTAIRQVLQARRSTQATGGCKCAIM